jgi:hypothetical protein
MRRSRADAEHVTALVGASRKKRDTGALMPACSSLTTYCTLMQASVMQVLEGSTPHRAALGSADPRAEIFAKAVGADPLPTKPFDHGADLPRRSPLQIASVVMMSSAWS